MDVPLGRSFEAYPRSSSMASSKLPASPQLSRAWEDLRREARKLESELDAKLAAYGKLAAGYDSSYAGKGESGLANEQLAHTKGDEIEGLLRRLSDVNDSMSSTLSGSGDARSHTQGRHRDVLQDFNQEFRRLSSSVVAARERTELFSSGSGAPSMAHSGQGSAGLLLRERTALAGSNAAMDDALGQAQAVASSLSEQRHMFDNIGGKLVTIGSRFPVVNGLLNAIRRKKNKDTLILSAVIAVCTLFTLIYWWNKR